MNKKILYLPLALFIVINVFAHEYILLASKYIVSKGEKIDLHLFVADGFNIEAERSFQSKITRKYELISNSGTVDLMQSSIENSVPIKQLTVDFEGLGLINMERNYAFITLDAVKFRSYLKEDNITNVQIPLNETKPQRERYTRYIKCLIQSDKTNNDSLYKLKVGHSFEIVLLSNPYSIKRGQQIKAKIYFKGQPLTNKYITARNRTGNLPAIAQKSLTDSNGICTFNISRKGEWFIHATHMIECSDKNEADWESFWTSFSFEIQ